MDKKGKSPSIAGRLFYTFGTILLLTMIIICSINFARDGRVLQKPILSQAKTAQTVKAGAGGSTDGYKTIKFKKPDAAPNTSSSAPKSKTTPKASGKSAAANSGSPAASKAPEP